MHINFNGKQADRKLKAVIAYDVSCRVSQFSPGFLPVSEASQASWYCSRDRGHLAQHQIRALQLDFWAAITKTWRSGIDSVTKWLGDFGDKIAWLWDKIKGLSPINFEGSGGFGQGGMFHHKWRKSVRGSRPGGSS